MIPGNIELVEVVCSMTINTGGVAAILSLDQRRLSPEQVASAWLPATREAAVLGAFLFGWLYGGPALVIHFVKSRRSFLGAGLGLVAFVLLLGLDVLAQLGAAATIAWLGL